MGSIPLRLIDAPPPAYAPLIDDGTIQPGDCWRDDFGETRQGWAVVLPNRVVWHTWQPASDGTPWDVTGEAPDLTVNPSISDRSPGREWHGWIYHGLLVGTDA